MHKACQLRFQKQPPIGVGMVVDIDESRSDDFPFGFNFNPPPRPGEISDFRNFVLFYAEAGFETGFSGAIDDGPVSDEDVEHSFIFIFFPRIFCANFSKCGVRSLT